MVDDDMAQQNTPARPLCSLGVENSSFFGLAFLPFLGLSSLVWIMFGYYRCVCGSRSDNIFALVNPATLVAVVVVTLVFS